MSRTTSLRQVDPSVVGADPFWATVADRHPHASYVLLPPDPAPAEPPPQRAEAVAEAVRATWLLLQEHVEAAGSTDTPAESWRGAPGECRLVARIALVGIGRGAGLDLAARVGVVLGQQGWRLDPRRAPELSTLDARSSGADPVVEVRVAVGEGATVVSLTAVSAVAS